MKQVLIFVCTGLLLLFPMRSVAQGSRVTVHLIDSTIVEAELVSVKDSSIMLSGDLVPAPDLGEHQFRIVPRTFSNSKIKNVISEVKAPGNASGAEKVVGGFVGSIVGGVAGYKIMNSIVEHPPGLEGIGSALGTLLLGGGLGVALGGYFGVSIVNHTTTMELTFDPKDHKQLDSLRVFARNYRK